MQILNIHPYLIRAFKRKNKTKGKDFLAVQPQSPKLKVALRSAPFIPILLILAAQGSFI